MSPDENDDNPNNDAPSPDSEWDTPDPPSDPIEIQRGLTPKSSIQNTIPDKKSRVQNGLIRRCS